MAWNTEDLMDVDYDEAEVDLLDLEPIRLSTNGSIQSRQGSCVALPVPAAIIMPMPKSSRDSFAVLNRFAQKSLPGLAEEPLRGLAPLPFIEATAQQVPESSPSPGFDLPVRAAPITQVPALATSANSVSLVDNRLNSTNSSGKTDDLLIETTDPDEFDICPEFASAPAQKEKQKVIFTGKQVLTARPNKHHRHDSLVGSDSDTQTTPEAQKSSARVTGDSFKNQARQPLQNRVVLSAHQHRPRHTPRGSFDNGIPRPEYYRPCTDSYRPCPAGPSTFATQGKYESDQSYQARKARYFDWDQPDLCKFGREKLVYSEFSGWTQTVGVTLGLDIEYYQGVDSYVGAGPTRDLEDSIGGLGFSLQVKQDKTVPSYLTTTSYDGDISEDMDSALGDRRERHYNGGGRGRGRGQRRDYSNNYHRGGDNYRGNDRNGGGDNRKRRYDDRGDDRDDRRPAKRYTEPVASRLRREILAIGEAKSEETLTEQSSAIGKRIAENFEDDQVHGLLMDQIIQL